ncbi:hypothetical protein LCGC14_2918510 [marine sediment metagenome]|uniref:Uncharacterized protein n=1 Tax=marine sediment metagenome TaxID=412755 RepID=A0A0F9AFJ9_9ZZZZ
MNEDDMEIDWGAYDDWVYEQEKDRIIENAK